MTTNTNSDRNLALELVRVTETAAIAGSAWVGRGDKNLADGAAVKAMRSMINTVDMAGVVVIGEGEKDNAPMLHNGELVILTLLMVRWQPVGWCYACVKRAPLLLPYQPC